MLAEDYMALNDAGGEGAVGGAIDEISAVVCPGLPIVSSWHEAPLAFPAGMVLCSMLGR